MTTVAYCAYCGVAQKTAANFCHSCGLRVVTASETTLPAVQQSRTVPALPWAGTTAHQVPANPGLPWAAPPPVAVDQACYHCGQPWGLGRACQFCRQVGGLPRGVLLSSPLRRLGAALLDTLLAIFTLAIGWLVWSLIIYRDGQTPGKQVLGMRCAIPETGRTAGWGRTFCREWLAKGFLFSVLMSVTFGLAVILYFWLLWDKEKQEIWDKIVGTIVVNDPEKLLRH
jgi:uncharacterized RDD family membrane protein YckC